MIVSVMLSLCCALADRCATKSLPANEMTPAQTKRDQHKPVCKTCVFTQKHHLFFSLSFVVISHCGVEFCRLTLRNGDDINKKWPDRISCKNVDVSGVNKYADAHTGAPHSCDK